MKITHPELDWRGATPVAKAYGDIYYSPEDALGEVRHNFVSCALPMMGEREIIVIGETGFGTGLNFLVTWHDWLARRRPGDRLIFVSTEAHPLRQDDLKKALETFTQLTPLAEQLITVWPVGIPGPHRRFFDVGEERGKVELWVLYGDALEELKRQTFLADAWYFDGFNPSENPALWSPDLLAECARLMAPGAVGGTFTVASVVRGSLSAAGLEVEKAPGFGRKRECLKIKKPGVHDCLALNKLDQIKIHGGGIAGTSLAWAAFCRGWSGQIFEPSGIASGASGNPAALVNFRPSKNIVDPWSRLLAASLSHVQPLYANQWLPHRGTYKPALDDDQAQSFREAMNAMGWSEEVLNWMASPRNFIRNMGSDYEFLGGLHSPIAGHVSAMAVCEDLALFAQDIHASAPDVWANGFAALQGAPSLEPVMRRNLGQVIWTHAEDSPKAPMPTTFGAYITPVLPGHIVLSGSTYIRNPEWGSECLLEPDATATAEIRDKIGREIWDGLPEKPLGARVGVRAFGKDHRPIVGQTSEGAWVLTGLGSRGFLTAPLLAEILLDEMEGREAAGLPTYDFKTCVHPSRFDKPSKTRSS